MASYGRVDVAKDPGSVVSVGVASGTLAAAHANRLAIHIKNTHVSQSVSIRQGPGTAVLGSGIVLAAGEGIVLREYTGILTAIASGAATTVALSEV